MVLVASETSPWFYIDGIYTLQGKYSWNKVVSYRWGEQKNQKNFKGVKEYYDLYITVVNSKLQKLFIRKDIQEIILRISINDREKANSILNSMQHKESN